MTVRFNVGGIFYELARSTLTLHPNTMLARLVDKVWAQDDPDPNDAHFIDRNGDRFQYVLDYMRDGEVNLPMTVSKKAFLKEMEYYGFDNVDDSSIAIGNVADATCITNAVSEDAYEQIESLEASIKEAQGNIEKWEAWIKATKLAHMLFVRSTGQEKTDDRLTVRLAHRTDQILAFTVWGSYQSKGKDYFEGCLGKYGLTMISVESPGKYPEHLDPTRDPYFDFTLERSNKKQKTEDKKGKTPRV